MSTAADFILSDYDVKNRCKRLDGKPVDLTKRQSQLVRYSPTGALGEMRLIRISNNRAGSQTWTAHNALGKFYLAGPMRGYENFNFPAFLMAARVLSARGFEILSPAEKDLESGFDPSRSIESQGFDLGASFRWDFDAVIRTNGIILLPGWEMSTGAKAERLVAHLCKREVYQIDEKFNLIEAPEASYELSWSPLLAEVKQ